MSQPPTGDPVPQPGITPPPPLPPPPEVAPTPPPAAPLADFLDEEDRAIGVTVTDGNRASVPQDSFRKLKEKAAARERTKVLSELAARAKAHGFEDVDSMLAALERKEITVTTPNQPTAPITPPPATPAAVTPPPAAAAPVVPATPPGDSADLENDRKLSDAQRKRLRQARQDMTTKTAQAEQQRLAAETAATTATTQLATFRAEQTLRDEVIRSGCTDVDYTFDKLFREHLKTLVDDKTPEGEAKLKAFDIKAWITEVKSSRPYLFGAVAAPATTGVPPGGAPATPDPAKVIGGNADASKKNAKDMSPTEWLAYKKANNIKI